MISVQVVVCPKRCKKEDPSSRVDDKLSDLIKQLSLHEGGIQYVNQATKGAAWIFGLDFFLKSTFLSHLRLADKVEFAKGFDAGKLRH